MERIQKYLKKKKYYISPKIKVKKIKISSFYRLGDELFYDKIGNTVLLADFVPPCFTLGAICRADEPTDCPCY